MKNLTMIVMSIDGDEGEREKNNCTPVTTTARLGNITAASSTVYTWSKKKERKKVSRELFH